MKIPSIPLSWTIVIVGVVLAIGISMVEISINQEQKNDQSQDVTQNTITKTVVVNIINHNLKIKNIRWEVRSVKNSASGFHKFLNKEDMEAWQYMYTKYLGNDNDAYCVVIYPVYDETETTFTNKNVVSNANSTHTTNTMKVKNRLFEKIKGLFD